MLAKEGSRAQGLPSRTSAAAAAAAVAAAALGVAVQAVSAACCRDEALPLPPQGLHDVLLSRRHLLGILLACSSTVCIWVQSSRVQRQAARTRELSLKPGTQPGDMPDQQMAALADSCPGVTGRVTQSPISIIIKSLPALTLFVVEAQQVQHPVHQQHPALVCQRVSPLPRLPPGGIQGDDDVTQHIDWQLRGEKMGGGGQEGRRRDGGPRRKLVEVILGWRTAGGGRHMNGSLEQRHGAAHSLQPAVQTAHSCTAAGQEAGRRKRQAGRQQQVWAAAGRAGRTSGLAPPSTSSSSSSSKESTSVGASTPRHSRFSSWM